MVLMSIDEEIYTHEYLWRSSTALAKRLEENEEDKHHLILPALMITFLAYEAFVNFCGFVLLPSVWAKERTHFKGKTLEDKLSEIITKLPNYNWRKGSRPYQTIKRLTNLREFIVHGKVIKNKYETERKDDGSHFRFNHKWDEFWTVDEVNKSRHDVEVFCQGLIESMRTVTEHRHIIFNAFGGSLASAEGHSTRK